MPGIAGIVLTVGMAVDANVLIFERIREEIRNGNSPQASIHAGYDKASPPSSTPTSPP
jgi:preprotein translocase subunit SecD